MLRRISPLAVSILAVALLWLWDLGGYGIASYTELPVVLRAERWLGIDHPGVPRAPAFGDLVRAGALAFGPGRLDTGTWSHLLLRLPGVLVALALIGLAGAWAKLRKLPAPGLCLLAAALPITSATARQLTPDLWAELAFTLFAWNRMARPCRGWRHWGIELTTLALLLHCAGLGWGLGPAFLWVWLNGGDRRWGLAGVACIVAAGFLALRMGEGYQHWLAAARDPLTLFEGVPRQFTASVMRIASDFGLWTVLIAFALVQANPELRCERRWLALVLASQALGSMGFESSPLVGIVPAASLVLSAAGGPLGRAAQWRQVLVGFVVGSALLLRTLPQYAAQLVWPNLRALEFDPHMHPELTEIEQIWRLEGVLIFALLVLRRWPLRRGLAACLVLLLIIGLKSQGGTTALAKQSSVRAVAAMATKQNSKVASQGIEDPGWGVYASPEWPRIPTQKEAVEHLRGDSRAALALNRESELRLSGALARFERPLLVQSAGHPRIRVLRSDAQNGSPYPPQQALQSALPAMDHRCKVIFDNALELVGWSLPSQVSRGRSVEFRAVFRVLKTLAGPRSFYVRVEQSPLSPWPPFGTPWLDARFPISQWRVGDLVELRQTWELPRLLLQGGEREISIALARSRYRYDPITFPTQTPPEQAELRWIGRRKTRIVLGRVRID